LSNFIKKINMIFPLSEKGCRVIGIIALFNTNPIKPLYIDSVYSDEHSILTEKQYTDFLLKSNVPLYIVTYVDAFDHRNAHIFSHKFLTN